MAITNIVIESNTQFPCVGGGFVYDIIAECDLALSASDSLAPILLKVGLPATSEVIGLSDASNDRFVATAVSLIPIAEGANLVYRLHTTGAVGGVPTGALAATRLRLIVVG